MATNPGDIPNLVSYVTIVVSECSTIYHHPCRLANSSDHGPCHSHSLPPFSSTNTTNQYLFPNPIDHLPLFPSLYGIKTVFPPCRMAIRHLRLGLRCDATSSLLNQILESYGTSEDQVGIDGAILMIVGLVASGAASPVLDRPSKSAFHSSLQSIWH